MAKSVLILFTTCFCLYSCGPVKNEYAESSDEHRWKTLVELNAEGYLGKPKVVQINSDSLSVTRAKGRIINVSSSPRVRNELLNTRAVGRLSPGLEMGIAASITPGVGKAPLPVTYAIPNSGILIQNGDTIEAPKVNTAYWPPSTPAQSMRFRDAALHDIQFVDIEQGLPSSYVDAIYEDKHGNMWFGTYGGGVTRYNGASFTTFTIDHGLPNNIIRIIYEDIEGNLWFGTDGSGISYYDGSTFTNYSIEQGLAGIYLETIIEDKEGNVWFGTNGGGLTCFSGGDHKTFTNYSTSHGLADNSVWASLLDDEGILWFGTRSGLSRFDGKSFKNFDEQSGLPDPNVRALFQDSSGNLWIGTEGGVSVYDGKSIITYTEKEGLIYDRIWHISQDIHGNVWLGTDGGGACMMSFADSYNLAEAYLTFYTQKEGLSYDFVRSMYSDQKGNMWFGIDGGGVAKLKTNSFTSFTANKHLSTNSVWAIYQDQVGDFWFGSDLWGIYKYEDGYFTSYMDDEGLLEYSVMDMLEDKSGNMWFATYGAGVVKYDGAVFTSFDRQEGFPHRDVYSMLEDKEGNLWFGTQGGGLVKFDGTNFTTYGIKDGLANDRIWDIHEDADGVLWIGSFGGGLSRFDGSSFANYNVGQGLLNSSVNSIFTDRKNNLWLGTDEGVNKIVFDSVQQPKLYSLTMNEGLVNGIVLSLIEDKQGVLWIGTEGGISSLDPRIDRSDRANAYRISSFVQSDGLKGLDVVINSVCLDDQNRLWWGTGKGLAMLEIENIKTPNYPPNLQLNGISIQQEFVDFRKLQNETYRSSLSFGEALYHSFDSILPFQNYPRNLSLPYHLNHISFQFSAIDWHAPHKLKYQFKLEGEDDGWSNITGKTQAAYQNLSYGDYVFHVKGVGAGGVWSDTISYPFTVVRPWWHTWWARILYVVFGFFGLVSFDRWRTYRILKNQLKLQKSIEERNRQLERMVEERTAKIKQQQQATEEANQVLEQKVKERTRELLEKNKKLAEYAFVNAHNLRVPVANIKGIIQLFENVQSNKERAELVELLKGQSDSLDKVLFEIKDMLERDNYQQDN